MRANGFQKDLSFGLVGPGGSLAALVRKVAEGGGFRLAFDISPEELESGHRVQGADVVLVIAPLAPRDGSVVGRVRARLPEARIVACSRPVESPTIRWALELGLDGLIWSDRVEQCLEPTVRAVHAGQVVVPRDLLQSKRVPEFTNREKQALSMVIMGLTNHEIAEKLFVSENTVKSHLYTAYKKLGVHSRAEAQRLITDPDQGLGAGILAITAPGLTRGRPPKKAQG
ncbi:MAG TPA: response regulator transcription factor [Gemmatimonadota bacterium]|jgi:DNA-binding NarL/FixJ family response regulator